MIKRERINTTRLFNYKNTKVLVIGAILFGVAYSQSPLYTSNQNQYFLHGLAAAGYGYLKTDWLANTTDPTPVYSLLIRLTYQLFKSNIPFYLYYFVLLGVYFMSLQKLMTRLTVDRDALKSTLIGAILIFVHSAVWRYMVTVEVGPEWAYLLEGGLANQRVLGVVFQPSTFGVFLMTALYAFVTSKEWPGLLCLLLAIYFHPTYLLAGFILFFSFLVSSFLEQKSLKFALSYGLAFFVLVLPILIHVNSLIYGVSGEVVSQAYRTLVFYRIPHHAVISEWFDLTSVVQLCLMILALTFIWKRSRRLFSIMAVCLGSMVLLSILQFILSSDMLALAFPWRISVILIPLATGVLIIPIVEAFWKFTSRIMNKYKMAIWVLISILLISVAAAGIVRFQIELSQQKSSPEFSLIDFVREEKQPGDVYLIPPKMQDFRLASGAPIYVDFKSIPYRPDDVLEWYRRIRIIERFYGSGFPDCPQFEEWVTSEGVNHVVVFPESEIIVCPEWTILFEDQNYVLLKTTG